MKTITLQIEVKVPNDYRLNTENEIQELLVEFPHNVIFIKGRVLK